MTTRIIVGDCRDVLKTLPEASVQCCVTSPPRKPNGQFVKGVHAYRAPRPHWRADWLRVEYVDKKRSASEIATDVGVTEKAIYFWLEKHGIPRRSISEARAAKHWGVSGPSNPMHGKTGDQNPRFVDGSSPERQRLYARGEGKAFRLAVLARDGFACRRCQSPKKGARSLHVHHLQPWAGNEALRFDPANAATLCRSCHHWVHSKKNTNREWLA